jgi:ribonucleoside-diphosphate reductase alpha chain
LKGCFRMEYPRFTDHALRVLERRYLKRDNEGRSAESPGEMFGRVARNIAEAERRYRSDSSPEALSDAFFQMMASFDFLPNSPCLMNAGRELQQLAACFVLPVQDSLESIFETVKHTALIHQSGGGTGFSFSHLRPREDRVRSTGGIASGPVSFMRVFNMATEVIKQGGTRRGANMGVLRVDHPDVLEFITIKQRPGEMENFNLSVGLSAAFMDALQKDDDYDLVSPRTGRISGRLKAGDVFDAMVAAAWQTGDPGVLFLDRINSANPTPQLGEIESTNPCGEVPLLPYEPCVLGSINLFNMLKRRDGKWRIDFEKLGKVARLSVQFLDNVIEMSSFPLPQVAEMARGNRKIGLGVMGLAHLLIRLGIPYNSREALDTASEVMRFIQNQGRQRSAELAAERGVFPNFKGSIYDRPGGIPLRNATITTVAPTGTLSLLVDCSSGIEPIYGVRYTRRALEDMEFEIIDPLFLDIGQREGFLTPEIERSVLEGKTLREISGVPQQIKDLFVTAFEISPYWHIKMQAAFQKYTDNAVSKTVNFPEEATKEDVREAYLMAYREGCKGITIYRSGSKGGQVLSCGTKQVC